jgi:hypothetical protein
LVPKGIAVGGTDLVPGGDIGEIVIVAIVFLVAVGPDSTREVGPLIDCVFPDPFVGLCVTGISGKGRDIGQRDVQIGRAHGVADGACLGFHRLMVLRVGPVKACASFGIAACVD